MYLLLMCLHNQVYAHNTTQVHPRLSIKAHDLIESKDSSAGAYKELYKNNSGGVPMYWGEDHNPPSENYAGYNERNVIDGVVQEDTPVTRVLNHFYHAVTENKLLIPVLLVPSDGHRSSKQTGIYNFNVAMDFYGYTEASKQLAYFWFGRSMHHVQDMSSPAHVHNDAHLTVFESEHDDYEGHYVPDNRNTGDMINFNGVNIRNVTAFSDIWATSGSLARFIYDSVLYQGNLDFPLTGIGTPPTPTGELADMFPAGNLHLEDYVLGLNPYWRINTVGNFHYQLTFFASDDWWDAPEFGGPAGYFYIEQTIPDSGTPVNPTTIRSTFPIPFSATNPYAPSKMNGNIKSLVQLYGEHLIIPAVEYSAGFAEWWYDIVNTPPYLKKIIVEQDSNITYKAEWQDELDTRINPSVVDSFIEGAGWVHEIVKKRVFVRDPDIRYMNALTNITFELEFNEPVKSDSIQLEIDAVNILDGVAPPVDQYPTGEAETRWKFTIPAEKFNGLNGELVLTVRAQDKNNHRGGGGGAELDGTPNTPARRQKPSSYYSEAVTFPWHTNLTVGVDGEVGSNAYDFSDGDQVHHLLFDTIAPVTNLDVKMN